MLGYLFGAGKFDAVARRVWVADLIAVALTTCVSTLIWINADAVFGLFTADPMVHELGRRCCSWRYSWASGVRSTS